MSVAGGQETAHITVKTLENLHNDQSFDLLGMKVNQFGHCIMLLMSHSCLAVQETKKVRRGNIQRRFC